MSTGEPLVTVVMPTYHQHQYLTTAIRSVQAQTYPKIQFLAVMVKDDVDTWDTLAPVRYELGIVLSEKADHIHQINLGLKEAKGDFVILMGSDDFMLPNKIEREMSVATATNAVLVYSRFFTTDERLNIQTASPLLPEFTYLRLVQRNFIVDSCLVAKSMYEEFGFFDEELQSLAVYDKWLRIAEKYENRIAVNTVPVILYRTHPAQKHSKRLADPKQTQLYERIVKASLRRKGLPTDGVKFSLHQVSYERV